MPFIQKIYSNKQQIFNLFAVILTTTNYLKNKYIESQWYKLENEAIGFKMILSKSNKNINEN